MASTRSQFHVNEQLLFTETSRWSGGMGCHVTVLRGSASRQVPPLNSPFHVNNAGKIIHAHHKTEDALWLSFRFHVFWFKDGVGKKRAAVRKVVSFQQEIPEELLGYCKVFSSGGTHKKTSSYVR